MTAGWWIMAILALIALAAAAEAWLKRGRSRPLSQMISRSVSARAGYEEDRRPVGQAASSRMPWLMPMTGRTADAMVARPHTSWSAGEAGPETESPEPNPKSEDET